MPRLRWLVGLVVLAAAADAAWYVHQGGDWRELPGHYAHRWDQAQQVHSRGRSWWKKEGAPRTATALRWASDVVRALRERIEQGETPPPVPSQGGSIAVHFAPVSPARSGGIDDAVAALAKNAKRSFYGAVYELESEAVAEALIARHEAGVDVRLVSDSDYRDRAAAQRCAAAGIPIVWDERSAFMHNKFCVVDGQTVWTGSTNLTDNGFHRNNNNAIRLVSPQLAAAFTAEFEEMHTRGVFGGGQRTGRMRGPFKVGDAEVVCYFSPDDAPRGALIALVDQARRTIDFMAFSFTSNELAEAMAGRLAQGVRVRGLFERRNAGSSYSRDEFLADRGAAIYLDKNPYAMHHKVIVLDEGVVVTGSYNFSNAAEERNDENILVIRDAKVAADYTAEFERLIH